MSILLNSHLSSSKDHTTMTLPFSSVYLCECCFHLYYLILHVSPEFAKNIYSRLGAQASNPSEWKWECFPGGGDVLKNNLDKPVNY